MNLEEIMFRTREIAGEAHSFKAVLEPELLEMVNEVYLEVCGQEEWPFLRRMIELTTVPSQRVYLDADVTGSLPDRVELVYVVGDNERRLHPLREAERVDHLFADNTDTSTPLTYDLLHEFDESTGDVVRQLVLFPTPDTAESLVIRGVGTPTVLALATDVPVFAVQFHSVIPYLTAAYMMAQRSGEWSTGDGGKFEQGDWEIKIQSTEARAGRMIERMARFYLQQHDDGLIQMGARRDSARRRRSRSY